MKMKLAATAVAALVAMGLAEGAHAETTFATFSALTGDNFSFQNASPSNTSADSSFNSIASSTGSAPGTAQVDFSFINLGSAYDNAVKNVVADLNWTGSSTTAAQSASGLAIQPGISGSFTITSTAPITIGNETFAAGSVLLSGVYTNGILSGAQGTTNGGFDVSNSSGATLTFASSFLTFSSGASLGSSLNFTSATTDTSTNQGLTSLNFGSDALESFNLDAGGSFSSVPVPTAAVPEPASWAMLLLGMGLMGGVLRRRNGLAATA